MMMMGQQQQQVQYNGLSLGWESNGLMHNDWINVTLPGSKLATTRKSIQGMSYELRNLEPDYQYEARIEAR